MQKVSTLAHFIYYFQIFNQNLIWSWMIYIACFLRSQNQWVCNSIKCALVLRAILTIAISKAMIVSYKLALRHISMRRSHLLSKRSNSRSSKLHMLAKIFRVNSWFWFTFRFSMISQSRSICRRCQEHFVIYLSSNWFTSIVFRIESNEISMRISFLRVLIWRSHKSCLFFESFTNDSSTLRESLLRESSRSC